MWQTRFSGKLNGEIAPTIPIGRRRIRPALPSPAGCASIGTVSPVSRRASSAEKVIVCTARSTSMPAVVIGLPASWAMVRANSSRRSREQRSHAVQHRRPLVRRQRALHRPLGRVDRAASRLRRRRRPRARPRCRRRATSRRSPRRSRTTRRPRTASGLSRSSPLSDPLSDLAPGRPDSSRTSCSRGSRSGSPRPTECPARARASASASARRRTSRACPRSRSSPPASTRSGFVNLVPARCPNLRC